MARKRAQLIGFTQKTEEEIFRNEDLVFDECWV